MRQKLVACCIQVSKVVRAIKGCKINSGLACNKSLELTRAICNSPIVFTLTHSLVYRSRTEQNSGSKSRYIDLVPTCPSLHASSDTRGLNLCLSLSVCMCPPVLVFSLSLSLSLSPSLILDHLLVKSPY